MISSNVKSFSKKELDHLYNFISSCTFDSNHPLKDIACKADLCNLLADCDPKFVKFRLAILSKLSKEDTQALSSYAEPLERSKLVRVGPIQIIGKDDKLLNNILNDSKENFIHICSNLKETQKDYDALELTITSSFQAIYEKLGLSSLDFETIVSLPVFFQNSFIDSFVKDLTITIKRKLDLFNFFAHDSSKQDLINEAFAVLNSFYFYPRECNIPVKEKEELVNTLLGFKPLYDSNNWLFNKGDRNQSMLSTKSFLPMSMLLQFIDINQWNIVKPLLEDKLSKENTNTIAKAISIFNLNKLLVLDSKWVEDNLTIIFNNIVQNRNLSFDLFSCSASLVPSFVLSLAKNNILVPLLDSEEFSQNSIVYLAHLLVGIIQKKSVIRFKVIYLSGKVSS